ncbi:hypothetical protein CPC08DRAFT_723868 [Agrocybe pediades]|nr:hypothetical protein CPC08DRAFT_723868 [Agrocybe pediades]
MPSISNAVRTFGRDKSPPINCHTSSVDVTIRQWSLLKSRRSDDSSKTFMKSICSPPMGEADAHKNIIFGSPNSLPAAISQTKIQELAASFGKSDGSQRNGTRIGKSRGGIVSFENPRLCRRKVAKRPPLEIYISVVTEFDLPDPPRHFWKPLYRVLQLGMGHDLELAGGGESGWEARAASATIIFCPYQISFGDKIRSSPGDNSHELHGSNFQVLYPCYMATTIEHEFQAGTYTDVERAYGGTRVAPNLPVELHGLIINELKSETEALKQHVAQKLLFKSIVFLPHSSAGVDEFVAFLEASPRIVNFIEQLIIREDKGITQLVRALINVVDLVLCGFRDFSRLDPASQVTILKKFQSLVRLTIRNINEVPLKVFDYLPRLEGLALSNTLFLDDPEVRLAQGPRHQPGIKQMKMGNAAISGVDTAIYQFFLDRGFGVDSLEMLSIFMNTQSAWGTLPLTKLHGATASLIQGYAKSLKVLDISISSNVPLPLPFTEPIFDVSAMPLLEELSIGCWISDGRDRIMYKSSIALRWLSRHLETIPHGRHFKSITIHLHIIGVYLVMDEYLDFEDFQYFEKLIVDVLLRRMESLSISILFDFEDRDYPHLGTEQMKKHLPRLQALNLLHFKEVTYFAS